MHVAALRVELRIRDAHSLKEKRRIVKAISAEIAGSFPIAVSEVDNHDLWQRATLGIAAVGPQPGQVDRMLHSVERSLRRQPDIEVLEVGVSYLENPQ